jgi:intein/homing endonuclease
MSQVLDSYGMCRAKSLILKFPECVPPELYSHCLRGYFDGDGCIPHSSTDYTTNIVGTKELLERVREIITPLGIKTSIKEAHPGRNKNTYVLYTTSKSGSKKFLDYMYDDATLYLYRKYDLYKSKYCA